MAHGCSAAHWGFRLWFEFRKVIYLNTLARGSVLVMAVENWRECLARRRRCVKRVMSQGGSPRGQAGWVVCSDCLCPDIDPEENPRVGNAGGGQCFPEARPAFPWAVGRSTKFMPSKRDALHLPTCARLELREGRRPGGRGRCVLPVVPNGSSSLSRCLCFACVWSWY